MPTDPMDLFAMLRGRPMTPPSPDLMQMMGQGLPQRRRPTGYRPMPTQAQGTPQRTGWPASRWEAWPKTSPQTPPQFGGTFPGTGPQGGGQPRQTPGQGSSTGPRMLPPQAQANPMASAALNRTGPGQPMAPSPMTPNAMPPVRPRGPRGY